MQDDMQDEKCNPAAKNGDGVFSHDNPVAIHQLIGAVPDIQDVTEDRAGQMTLDADDYLLVLVPLGYLGHGPLEVTVFDLKPETVLQQVVVAAYAEWLTTLCIC